MARTASPVSRLPRRDRTIILIGLSGVTALAWLYLVRMSLMMDGAMMPADVLRIKLWSSVEFSLMFLMWAVMMVGMMVPTAIPMTLIYAAIVRKASRNNQTLAPAAIFISGYVAVWTLFSLVATLAQWLLDQTALLSPMMVSTSPLLGASLLVMAGIYQLTPAKEACLQHCRAPAHFIAEHWRPGFGGAFRMGLEHGAYCLGCCWILMGLLFLGGVMNLLWIAAITLFVLLEKVLPFGVRGGRLAGWLMIFSGIALVVTLQ